MDFDLVIFDCDGVLIDSEILANRAEVELLKSFGIEFELSDYMARFVGKSTKDVLKSIESSHNICLPAEFRKLAGEKIYEVFKKELKPIPGIFELLDSLAEPLLERIDLPKCIGSSSSLHRLKMTLTMTGLFDRFAPHIFSADLVSRGKPAPDLFLFAAEKMKVNPDRCIVIEDSPHGVRAGVDAGMTVLGFIGGSHIQAEHDRRLIEEGAIKVFSTMGEISAWLKNS
jgi:beta-phosphoglucomutase-like phosphatase (HAD superfamily)